MKIDPIIENSLTQIINDLDEILPNTNPSIFIQENKKSELDEKFILDQLYK